MIIPNDGVIYSINEGLFKYGDNNFLTHQQEFSRRQSPGLTPFPRLGDNVSSISRENNFPYCMRPIMKLLIGVILFSNISPLLSIKPLDA
jgi:hypothetical protein